MTHSCSWQRNVVSVGERQSYVQWLPKELYPTDGVNFSFLTKCREQITCQLWNVSSACPKFSTVTFSVFLCLCWGNMCKNEYQFALWIYWSESSFSFKTWSFLVASCSDGHLCNSFLLKQWKIVCVKHTQSCSSPLYGVPFDNSINKPHEEQLIIIS